MFNIGGGELLVILLVALIVLGPDKLPQAARQVGRFTSEARKMADGFRAEMKSAMDESDTGDTSGGTRLAAAPTDALPIEQTVEGPDAGPAGGGAEPTPGPAAAPTNGSRPNPTDTDATSGPTGPGAADDTSGN
jgi:sec-independent protein translocase protein TatB